MGQIDHALGARIKAAMKAAGFPTAKKFCKQYDVAYLTFAQHLQGRRTPKPEFFKLYSNAFGVTQQWLKTGEGHPLAQNHSDNTEQRKKIESTFEKEINKFQFQTHSMINPELLALILEGIIQLKVPYSLSERKCAHIVANLYAQVSKTTQEPELQKNMVSAFIHTFETALK